MQRFSYARTGAGLRNRVSMFTVVILFEVVFWAGISLLLRPPWNWLLLGGGLALTAVALWIVTGGLRRRHQLDGARLTLAFGSTTIALDRADLEAVVPLPGPPPREVEEGTPVYRAADDTLYLLAGRKGLVALRLTRPYESKVPGKGICQFTRVVLSLDEPDRFLAALGVAPVPVAVGPILAPAAVALVPPAFAAPTPVDGPAAIELRSLVRRYGDFTAVRGIDLAVRPGEVLAFLGGNGAGKTTTIKMMTGLLRPTAGQVLIEGRDLWADGPAVRHLVGYVPDVPLLYESLTAREFLWLMAGLYGIAPAQGRERADRLLALLKLERFADSQIRSFSLGMKRKMAIGAALIHQPRVLLLDEVTNGLDPRAAREVKDFIAQAAAGGAAVFLTTHILTVAQELAHRIAVIHRGELRALGTLAELRQQVGAPDADLEQLFLALTGDTLREEASA